MSKHDAPMVSFEDGIVAGGLGLPTSPIVDEDARPKLPKGARWQDDGTVLLGLRYPVRQVSTGPAGDVETTTDVLALHPLTGADIMRAQASKGGVTGSMGVLIQASTRMFGPIGEDFLKRMDARDYVALTMVVEGFTDPGR
jgi:hypothetical protein